MSIRQAKDRVPVRKYSNPLFCLGIYITNLFLALRYSFINNPAVRSDSLLEYNTYLLYIEAGKWYPIYQNLISSCLTTTYLPSLVQRLFNTPVEATYYVVLSALLALLPVAIFLLFKKGTHLLVVIGCVLVIMSSFYFTGFTSYARLSIAVVWIVLWLWSLSSDKWRYLVPATLALVVITHYATSYNLLALVGLASVLGSIYYWRKREFKTIIPVLYSLALLCLFMWVWYYLVEGTQGSYGTGMIKDSITDVVNGEVKLLLPASTFPTIQKNVSSYILLGTAIVQMILIVRLFIVKKVDISTWLHIGALAAACLSLLIPHIEIWYGQLRAFYILLPFGLVTIVKVVNQSNDKPPLGYVWCLFMYIVIYH